MKIVINALPYNTYQGIENFLTNLLRAWPHNEDEITVLANEISAKFLQPLPAYFKLEIIKFKKIDKLSIFIFQQFKLGRLLKKRKTDILFCASLNCPWLYPQKIVTIHDAAPFIIKGESSRFGKIYWLISLFFAKHFSRHLLTVSEFSRQELINKLKINQNKLSVIYNGAPVIPVINKNQTQTVSPYIIVIGNARKRKNLTTLLAAYNLIKTDIPDLRLIVVGKMDKRMQILANSYQNDRIEFTGFISDENKYQLLSQAQALIFPSLYEGFGLPILEAQIMGTPIICSNIPVFKEVANTGAFFFNPLSASDLAEKIKKIINNPVLAANLKNEGSKNYPRFNWQKSAKKLVDILHLYENSSDK